MAWLIAYDLCKPEQNYYGVIKTIMVLSGGNCCHCGGSVWLVRTNGLTKEAIYGKIQTQMDADDNLLVIEVKENYCSNFNQYVLRAIHERIF